MKKNNSYITDYGMVEKSDVLGHLVFLVSCGIIIFLILLAVLAIANT